MKTGNIIHEKREQSGITQDCLAQRLFVSRTLVSKWENGSRYPSKENLEKLAIFFNCSTEEIIGGTDEKKKNRKYSILSVIYSALCLAGALFFIVFAALYFKEITDLESAWTFIAGIFVAVPGFFAVGLLFLFEILLLIKKGGYKKTELISFISIAASWLLLVAVIAVSAAIV